MTPPDFSTFKSESFSTQLAPSALGMTVNNFYKAYTDTPRSLILRPAFQRNLVWNLSQKSYLIDSILRGYPVPEVYIQKLTDADGDEEIIVVDGQQRISTCIDYILGTFTLDDSEELDAQWRGKAFDELDAELRSRFRSFEFVARQLPNIGDRALRQVFRRLNRTVESLQPQELRHAAYTGDFIRIVESAASNEGLSELSVFTFRDTQRRRHDEFMSEVFYAFCLGTFPDKKAGMDELYMTYEKQGIPAELEDKLIRSFGRVSTFLNSWGDALKRTRFRNKSDAYTLLYYLMDHAESIPRSREEQGVIVDALREFSSLVNGIRRLENTEGISEGLEAHSAYEFASSYLHAVERAASDRQNRVRRYKAISSVLDPAISPFDKLPLTAQDAGWFELEDELNDDHPDADFEEELEEVNRVLLDE